MSAKSKNNLVKFELNRAGVRELLRSQEMLDMITQVAQERCPEECVVDGYIGTNRVNARITTDSDEAYLENLSSNTLLKAIGGEGGA